MKSGLLLLFISALSIVSFAANGKRPIWGTLQFGMTAQAADEAMKQFRNQKAYASTATGLRNHFIASGTKRPGKLTASDGKIHVEMQVKAEPLVTEIEAFTFPNSLYDTVVKTSWQDFQDIGDSKFDRLGKVGTFPTVEDFVPNRESITTDAWEADGIHVELIVHREIRNDGKAYYWPSLKATEVAPPPTK